MIDLFARNFDSDNAPAAPVTTIDEEELNLRLAEARKQGFDAGRAVGQQDAKAEFDAHEDARLEAESAEIRAQLDALIAQDTRQCRATETDIVELFLGIGDRLVPELLQNYGVDLAIGRIRESVALSRSTPVLSITACPEVAARLKAEPPVWLPASTDAASIKIVADSDLPRGAARVVWQGGKLEYDLEEATTAVRSALQTAAVELTATTRIAE